MKTVTKPQFICDDGRTFDNEIEAQAHETKCKISADVSAFLKGVSDELVEEGGKEAELSPRAIAMRTNVIMDWEAHKALAARVVDIKQDQPAK